MRKVRIKLPKARTGFEVAISAKNMGYGNKLLPEMNDISKKPTEVHTTLQPVPREDANLEAERGETVVTNPDNSTLPAQFKIGGKLHSEGGTPLDLPSNSFIFSNDKKMKIKDPDILSQFGMAAKNSGYTPADIAKKYDINKYRQILADPSTDKIQKATAEKMIQNYMDKLGKLALVQESKKSFPQGIPSLAIPYLEKNNIDPTHLVTGGGSNEEEQELPEGKYGYNVIPELFRFNLQQFGGQPMEPMQTTFEEGGEAEGDNPTAQRAYESLKRVKVVYPKFAKGGPLEEDPTDEEIAQGLNISDKELAAMRAAGVDPLKMYNARKGEVTPTGADPSAKLSSEDFVNKLNKLGINTEKKTNAELQSELYDKADPFRLAYMWGVHGDTKKGGTGSTFSTYAPKVYANGERESFSDYENRLKSSPESAKNLAKFLSENKKSFADGNLGSRTAFLLENLYKKKEAAPTFNYVPKKKDDTPLPDVERAKVDVKNAPQEPADFWLQDIIKTAGAAGDYMRIKKYLPWMATYDPYTPRPTFYDPTRELAANAEQANIAATAAGQFSGPQALAGRLSGVQGQASTNAANILGKYNNLNVGVANQFENTDAGILNQFGARKAAQATELYDKNTIANQQYDNAKAMARQQLRQSMIDAITNRAQTQGLNYMYGNQYKVDPLSGGITTFYNPREMKPGQQQEDFLQQLETMAAKHPVFFKENPEIGKAYIDAMLGK